jgi:hypothetical protein
MILNRKFLKFEIDLDFLLIAITSPLKDYRICYLINKFLHFNFVKIDDLKVDLNAVPGPLQFSRYHYQTGPTETDFYFIANKSPDGHLLPEMGRVDYFLLIKNYMDEKDFDGLLSGLNKIPEIVAAVKIDPKKIKSRENLLF